MHLREVKKFMEWRYGIFCHDNVHGSAKTQKVIVKQNFGSKKSNLTPAHLNDEQTSATYSLVV